MSEADNVLFAYPFKYSECNVCGGHRIGVCRQQLSESTLVQLRCRDCGTPQMSIFLPPDVDVEVRL